MISRFYAARSGFYKTGALDASVPTLHIKRAQLVRHKKKRTHSMRYLQKLSHPCYIKITDKQLYLLNKPLNNCQIIILA